MKFEKGMKAETLWEFLHFNIFDYFDGLTDYAHNKTKLARFLMKDGRLKKEVEIIIKIEGKIQPDCWEKEK